MGYRITMNASEVFAGGLTLPDGTVAEDGTIIVGVEDDGQGVPGNVTLHDSANLGAFSVNPVPVGGYSVWTPSGAGNSVFTFTNDVAGWGDDGSKAVTVQTRPVGYRLDVFGPHQVGQDDEILVSAEGDGAINPAFDGTTTITVTSSEGGEPMVITPPRHTNGFRMRGYAPRVVTYAANSGGAFADPQPVSVTVRD